MGKVYEYKFVGLKWKADTYSEDIEKLLNKHGALGWELVTVIDKVLPVQIFSKPELGILNFYFKRFTIDNSLAYNKE